MVTPESIKAGIEAGLACQHVEVVGDGQHFQALVVSAGMAILVAPLTTAVLRAVDEHHVGTASGLNSAVSRSGGLIVVALLGAVLSKSGAALIDALHGATLVGAGLALVSALTAFATLGKAKLKPARAP